MISVRWIRYSIVVGFVALLELACRTGAIHHRVVIPPSDMVRSLFGQIRAGHVFDNLLHTYLSIGAALAAAIVGGVFLGLLFHAFPRVRRSFEPFFSTYYAVPFFIFYPVLLSIFGVSRLPIVLMAFAFAVVAVILATLNALDRQPRVLRKIGAVHHMSWPHVVTRLSLPAAAPYLFTGIKLAVAYCFIGVLACEFLLSSVGIGHAISFAYNGFDNETMYGLILLVVLMVVAVNATLQAIEQYLLRRHGAGTRSPSASRAIHAGSTASQFADAALVVAGLVAIWQVLHWITGSNAISAPLDTLVLLGRMMSEDRYWVHVTETLSAFAIALGISYGAGVIMGGAIGLHRTVAEAVEPILISLYSLPKILILPIILLIFGIGVWSKITFGVLHSILPIMLFTIGAIRKIRPIYVKMGRTMHLSPVGMLVRIAVPAALPEIVTGLRIGFSLTLLGVLIGEMFASKRGLGYLIMNSIGSGDVTVTMAVALFLFTLAGVANAVLLHLDRRLLKFA